LRARLAARGRIGDEFEWGLRLATGQMSDANSTNQTLTDFFSRKTFALDQAFVTWRPKAIPGLQVQGGKFETPWWRTEIAWDNDNSPEGLNERYTFTPKKSAVKELTFLAWQAPMLERNAAFVLGSDGLVDLSASARAGRDLALYGGQLRASIEPSKSWAVRLAVTDNHYSGTQFITPAQFFGPNVTFPVTVNIPASGTTPARTVSTTVSVPREFLVNGNPNLGLSTATNNAVNRDGRLSSGFNLVDLYAQLDFNRRSRRWPALFLFNFVKNTQAHDVVTAGPAGADLPLANDEDAGYWAEFQLGKDVLRLPVDRIARGDFVFNYTTMRIEKDAVLTPFNFSDIGQQTDVRVHRFIAAYAVDPRVSLSVTGFVTQRLHGLLGPFAVTPTGSLNRNLTRIQLDTIFRF
ncbi:MAG TPA: putative porin, partial [Pyrinomonadaceae bacterium]|nr:putative porin [Pyrinomonadaceae bacterium]